MYICVVRIDTGCHPAHRRYMCVYMCSAQCEPPAQAARVGAHRCCSLGLLLLRRAEGSGRRDGAKLICSRLRCDFPALHPREQFGGCSIAPPSRSLGASRGLIQAGTAARGRGGPGLEPPRPPSPDLHSGMRPPERPRATRASCCVQGQAPVLRISSGLSLGEIREKRVFLLPAPEGCSGCRWVLSCRLCPILTLWHWDGGGVFLAQVLAASPGLHFSSV